MPGTEPGIALNRVVAVLAHLPNGGYKTGSGYLIDGWHVLTAKHCTCDRLVGAEAQQVQVFRATGGAGGRVVDIVRSRKLDVALLRLDGETPWAEDMPRPVYARIDRTHSGELDNCECIGFPQMQSDPDMGRHTLEYHGVANQTDGADTGRLLIRDERIHPGPIDDSGAGSAASDKYEPWGGLSGAVVFYQGQAIGIVVEHHPQQGDSALQAIGFDTIAKAGAWDKETRRIASALGLPPAEALPLATSASARPSDAPPSPQPSDVPTSPVPSISAATAQTEAQENLRRASARQTLEPARWTGFGIELGDVPSPPLASPPAATPPTEFWQEYLRRASMSPRQPGNRQMPEPVRWTGCMIGGANALSGASLQAGQALNEGADQLQAQVRQTELTAAREQASFQDLTADRDPDDASAAAASFAARAAQTDHIDMDKVRLAGFDQIIEG